MLIILIQLDPRLLFSSIIRYWHSDVLCPLEVIEILMFSFLSR